MSCFNCMNLNPKHSQQPTFNLFFYHHRTFGGVVVADVPDGVSDDLLVVDVGPGGDLPGQQDHPRLSNSLCGHKDDQCEEGGAEQSNTEQLTILKTKTQSILTLCYNKLITCLVCEASENKCKTSIKTSFSVLIS